VTSTSTIPSKNKSPIAKAKSPIAKAKVIADDPVTEEETIDDGIVVAGSFTFIDCGSEYDTDAA